MNKLLVFGNSESSSFADISGEIKSIKILQGYRIIQNKSAENPIDTTSKNSSLKLKIKTYEHIRATLL